jgi:hypothetical protein
MFGAYLTYQGRPNSVSWSSVEVMQVFKLGGGKWAKKVGGIGSQPEAFRDRHFL